MQIHIHQKINSKGFFLRKKPNNPPKFLLPVYRIRKIKLIHKLIKKNTNLNINMNQPGLYK
jgi:hypothetical protein